MDKKNEHIKQLTPELILAYHSGILTSAEMHQVELLMLESPLYDEGMAGLESLSSEQLLLDVDSLSARIDEATEEEKTGFWTTWKKAAAVILVLIIASGLFYFNQPTDLPTKELSALKKATEKAPSDSAATNTTQPPQDDELEIQQPSSSKNETAALNKPTPSLEVIEGSSMPETKEEENIFDEQITQKPIALEPLPALKSMAFTVPSITKKSDSLLGESIKLKLEGRTEKAQSVVQNQSAKRKLENDVLRSSFFAESQTGALATNSVKGKVVGSDDGLPLPQVTVLEKGTVNGKQTNQDGEFNFQSLKPNTTLVFRYLGYVTQEVKVGTNREINIKLSPDVTSLGEVVVTGVAAATPEKKLPFTITTVEGGDIDGTRAKTNVGNTQSSTRAKPVGGYPKFRRYLKKNLKYPEFARTREIKGQVTVEFRLSSTGELFDFRIIKGLGSGCDEEAIRLIKEGPKWNPKTVGADKTPVLSVVTVKVKFRP